jgi:hypothetical protein
MLSKYSAFVVGTRRNNLIFMSKKFSVPLTSESVTSGQAGGVFRQLFFQCIALHVQYSKCLTFTLEKGGLSTFIKGTVVEDCQSILLYIFWC